MTGQERIRLYPTRESALVAAHDYADFYQTDYYVYEWQENDLSCVSQDRPVGRLHFCAVVHPSLPDWQLDSPGL